MYVQVSERNSCIEIEVFGRLDAMTTPRLESIITQIPDDVKEIIFNLNKLDYISSAGIRVFLMTYKRFGKTSKISVINVTLLIKEKLDMLGVSNFLEIYAANE